MAASENLILTNPGNSEAKFKFTLIKEKFFIPSILEGTVQAKQSLTIPITLMLSEVNKVAKKVG
jgi:hypothetical protein